MKLNYIGTGFKYDANTPASLLCRIAHRKVTGLTGGGGSIVFWFPNRRVNVYLKKTKEQHLFQLNTSDMLFRAAETSHTCTLTENTNAKVTTRLQKPHNGNTIETKVNIAELVWSSHGCTSQASCHLWKHRGVSCLLQRDAYLQLT